MQIKLVSWNVNGLRAVVAKESWKQFTQCGADIVGLQEVKASEEQLPEFSFPCSTRVWCPSVVKRGYSGVGVLSTLQPLAVDKELPHPEYQGEGRVIHMEFKKFHFINSYIPNGGEEILGEKKKHMGLFKRLDYKMGFLDAFFSYLQELRKSKPIVVCGDFNIAHKEIDLARPKQNVLSTGFLPIERAFLDRFVDAGYIDSFRYMHPDEADRYSWWSYRMKAREKNIGWRLDYFFVSDELKGAIKAADIESNQVGSDHCPVSLVLEYI